MIGNLNDLAITNDTTTEDLNVNDIFDRTQGYVYFVDTIEIDANEEIRADTANLNLVGGTDPVTIGGASVAGTNGDLYVIGDLDVLGTKNCVIEGTSGKVYNYSAIESSEVWLEEKLSGRLVNGIVEILIDNRFLDITVINETYPLHANVTPTENCNGLWIEKFSDKVIIHELNNGQSNASFDLTISAKRIGFEGLKFDELIKDEDTNSWYKKRDEAMFLEKKPLKIQMNSLKEETKILRDEISNSKIEIEKNSKIKLLKDKKKEIRTLRDESIIINEKHKNSKVFNPNKK